MDEKEVKTEEVIKDEPKAEASETVEETIENSDAESKDEKVDEVTELKKANEVLEAKVAELTNSCAKAYADTENTRKRLQKEYESLGKYKIQGFALAVLPVLDDCERALAQETNDEAMHKGLEMIRNKLKTALEAEGVVEIEAQDQPFDGNWHQAVMCEHVDGVEPGMVVQVLQKGYKLKDRLLRAAMVKVSD